LFPFLKSYIVNIRHIQQVMAAYIVVKECKIPIGRTFRKDVMEIIRAQPR
jgi:DNA-binding LytR/AlgR family response regulator